MSVKTPILIDGPTLQSFTASLFEAAGVAPDMAQEWARSLVWAQLRGIDSHGVMRVPRYVELLAKKAINGTPNIRVEKRAGAIAVLEADLAPGPIGMARAMDEAIDRARAVHIGWCAARNITHAGAIGYFAMQAAEAGMAGMVMTASGPLMAYHGARVSGVSTNPLAVAFPADDGKAFLIDMSTANVALGKVLNARETGQPVPFGWGIDREGRATEDPKEISTLLPMAGPKGSGLSFMIECLCSLTVGNPIVAAALESGGALDNPYLNGVAIAVDLSAFGDVNAIKHEASRLGMAVTALPRAENVDRIYLPGERGASVRRQRERDGIPIAKGTWSKLLETAVGLKVEPPAVDISSS